MLTTYMLAAAVLFHSALSSPSPALYDDDEVARDAWLLHKIVEAEHRLAQFIVTYTGVYDDASPLHKYQSIHSKVGDPLDPGEVPLKHLEACPLGAFVGSNRSWEDAPATESGMVDGFDDTLEPDVTSSIAFIDVMRERGYLARCSAAFDVPAGVGRVSKHVISRFCKSVDLLEEQPHFLEKSHELLKGIEVPRRYQRRAQDFTFEKVYDLIWVQWLATYCSDTDLRRFLSDARRHLSAGGLIIVKENETTGTGPWGFVFYRRDCTLARSRKHLELLFAAAGLDIIDSALTEGIQSGLSPIRMWALQPTAPVES